MLGLVFLTIDCQVNQTNHIFFTFKASYVCMLYDLDISESGAYGRPDYKLCPLSVQSCKTNMYAS